MLRGVLLFGLLIVSLAAAGCGADGDTEMPMVSPGQGDVPATDVPVPPPEATPQVVPAEAGFLPLELADSVETLTLLREVMVGRITGIALPYNPIPGYGGVAPPTAQPDRCAADPSNAKCRYGTYPSEEEINREPGRSYTVFSVEVVDPGSTGHKPGETIYLEQVGGVYEGVQYQNEGSPLLGVGKTYLLAISPDTGITKHMDGKPGYAIGAPFAQFIIDKDTVRPIDPMWAELPAVKELTGKTPEAALDAILTARAQLAAESPTPAP